LIPHYAPPSSGSSICEHFLQSVQDLTNRVWRQTTEAPYKAFSVHRAQLVKSHKSGSLLKATRHPPGILLAAGGHGRHDCRLQVMIELVRRHHNAGTCLANLASEGAIESDQVNVAA
jgi:hypothetical protein